MPSLTTSQHRTSRLRQRMGLSAVLATLLSGCATFSPDGGFAPIAQTARQHLGQATQWARSESDLRLIEQRVTELLAAPMTTETALQIALLNNRNLQARYQALGIAEAELVQASRWPNPRLGLTRLVRGGEVEIERSLGFDLGHLITLPLRREMATRQLAATQHSVTMDMLALADQVRKAQVMALADEQSLAYLRQVKQAADAGAELARRMALAGNWTALQQAREHGFYAQATLALARGEQQRTRSREQLIRLLGLWGAQTQFTLPERLPDLPNLPNQLTDQPDIEQRAMAQRLDVAAAKQQLDDLAHSLGLSRVAGLANALEAGVQRNTSNAQPTQRAWQIGFEIPLFDSGDARQAKAQAQYQQAVHSAAQLAVNARSEVREAYLGYRSAYDIARHYRDDMVPAAQRVMDENLLRYNGMLIGVFELLAERRAQIATVNAAIDALRDFWLAQADLDRALLGKPSAGGMLMSPGMSAGGTAAGVATGASTGAAPAH